MNNLIANKLIYGLSMLAILLVMPVSKASAVEMALGQVILPDGQTRLTVEIAATQAQLEYGLMERTSMAEDHGMLFVFPKSSVQYMWMKNTLLALDVLFLTEDGHIGKILSNVQPCTMEPCTIYDSDAPAAFMLEVNAGYAARHQLSAGQKLLLPLRSDNKKK